MLYLLKIKKVQIADFFYASPFIFHTRYYTTTINICRDIRQSNPMIGDVMERAAHFMKMYSLYVQQFQSAINFVTKWRAKSTAFNAIMTSIEQTPECMGLKLEVDSIFCFVSIMFCKNSDKKSVLKQKQFYKFFLTFLLI